MDVVHYSIVEGGIDLFIIGEIAVLTARMNMPSDWTFDVWTDICTLPTGIRSRGQVYASFIEGWEFFVSGSTVKALRRSGTTTGWYGCCAFAVYNQT